MTRTDEIQSKLFARDPTPPLEPGTNVYDPSLTKDIAGLKDHKYVVAVLHLANDDIEGCHLIAQAHEGDPTANLLHATLHRREGDYWNSKYWYSRVKHPLIPSTSTAKQFVDSCEQVSRSRDKTEETRLREKQWEELKTMVKWIRENHQ